jgi:hypothetical protein
MAILWGVMFSAIYAFAPQGRIGGVDGLVYGQLTEMIDDDFAMSNRFKTSLTYGLQAVIVSSVSKKLLLLYAKYIRPLVSSNLSVAMDNFLFLTFDGEPMQSNVIGTLVTKTFENLIGYHTTTTLIRSMVETMASTAHDQGITNWHEN